LGKIGLGWIFTPIASAVVCFVSLFFVQNVFLAKIVNPISFEITPQIIEEIKKTGIQTDSFNKLKGEIFNSQYELRKNLNNIGIDKEDYVYTIFNISKIENFIIDSNVANQKLSLENFDSDEIFELKSLHSKSYKHKWEIVRDLSSIAPDWQYLEDTQMNKYYNKNLKTRYEIIFDTFRVRDNK
jgi:PiT family inorganic phosphate transporter